MFLTSLHMRPFWAWECAKAGKGDGLQTNACQIICDEGPVFKMSNQLWTAISETYDTNKKSKILSEKWFFGKY